MALGNGSYFPAHARQASRPGLGRDLGSLLEKSLGSRSQHGDVQPSGSPFSTEPPHRTESSTLGRERPGTRLELPQSAVVGSGSFYTYAAQHSSFSDLANQRSLPAGRLTGPVQFIRKLMTAWNMNEDEIRILLGFEPQDLSLVKDILKGYSSLRGRDIKDRVAIFLDIRKSLHTLFRNSEVEKHWLNERQIELGGKSPKEYLLEGSMISLLRIKDFVDEMCGR
jgi:hypothetical protein